VIPAPAPVSKPTPAPAAAPVVAAPAEPDSPALDSTQEALAREALHQKISELDAANTVARVEPTPAPTPSAPPVAITPDAPPTTAVGLPPSQKQGLERLAELTEQYRAGLMTPAEYHQQRAKIIQSLR
jgi:hypothetical protein